jgi:hypothetical protein
MDRPVFLDPDGARLDRHAAGRISDASPAALGSPSVSGRTPCVTPSLPPPSTPVSPCATSKRPPPTPTPEPPCATTADASPSTATPPTSSRLRGRRRPLNRHHRPSGAAESSRPKAGTIDLLDDTGELDLSALAAGGGGGRSEPQASRRQAAYPRLSPRAQRRAPRRRPPHPWQGGDTPDGRPAGLVPAAPRHPQPEARGGGRTVPRRPSSTAPPGRFGRRHRGPQVRREEANATVGLADQLELSLSELATLGIDFWYGEDRPSP